MKKRGLDTAALKSVVGRLCAGQPLDERNRDHVLPGDYAGFREYHIKSDWLLVYAVGKERLVLIALRTGTHSDLFGK